MKDLLSVSSRWDFFPCRAEPDIWMRDAGDCYEYVAVYVDDLAFALKDPQAFVKILQEEHNFKLKGTGPIEHHLGADFARDSDGILKMTPTKCINRLGDACERMFGEKPSQRFQAPLEAGDHPELDTSELLDADGIQKYQSLIGSLQWAISIGRST